MVYTLRDHIGAKLDRIQIVKGWLDADGKTHEKVYDVAWSPVRELGTDGNLPARCGDPRRRPNNSSGARLYLPYLVYA